MQFGENLHEAQLVTRAQDCQHNTSLYNQHSHQDELLKAVLLAGLYPNLIQVHGNKGVYYTYYLPALLHQRLKPEL